MIVPGQSVGEISLGDDMEQVGKKLGNINMGDAAMGKVWSIWYSKDSIGNQINEVSIYSSYRDTNMRVKDVKQISFTSNQFRTQDGFTTNRTLNNTKMKSPALEPLSYYLNEKKDTVFVYDQAGWNWF